MAMSTIKSMVGWRADWRLRRAKTLLQRNERPKRYDDFWVRRCFSFLGWRGGGGRGRRPARGSDIQSALALHEIDDLRRWHTEARLLTDQDLSIVSSRCGVPVGAVEAYAAICFAIPHSAPDLLAQRLLP